MSKLVSWLFPSGFSAELWTSLLLLWMAEETRNNRQRNTASSTQERGEESRYSSTWPRTAGTLCFCEPTRVTRPWWAQTFTAERGEGVISSHCNCWLWIALVEPFPTTCMGKWGSSMPSPDTGPGSDCSKRREDACVYAEGETITPPLLQYHPDAVLSTLLTPASPLISCSMPRGVVGYQLQFLAERRTSACFHNAWDMSEGTGNTPIYKMADKPQRQFMHKANEQWRKSKGILDKKTKDEEGGHSELCDEYSTNR